MDAFIDLRPLFPYVGPVPHLWSAARPVSIPQSYLGPHDGEFGVGDRVWWYRFGEWVEVFVVGICARSRCTMQREWKVRVVGEDCVHQHVKNRCVSLNKPADCGAMCPPMGDAGIRVWIERGWF